MHKLLERSHMEVPNCHTFCRPLPFSPRFSSWRSYWIRALLKLNAIRWQGAGPVIKSSIIRATISGPSPSTSWCFIPMVAFRPKAAYAVGWACRELQRRAAGAFPGIVVCGGSAQMACRLRDSAPDSASAVGTRPLAGSTMPATLPGEIWRPAVCGLRWLAGARLSHLHPAPTVPAAHPKPRDCGQ